MAYRIITPPTSEPLTLAEVKKHLRVDHSDEDELIEMLLQSAREHVENYTGQALLTQEVEEYFDTWPECCTITLSVSPVQETDFAISYIANGSTTYTNFADFDLDTVSQPARIVLKSGKSWPSLNCTPNAVKTTYKAGETNAANIPAMLKNAMLLLIGFAYENREDIPVNETNNPKIRSAQNLMRPHKITY